MVNKVILVGNVGADPEIRHINENSQVASFSLATSESYKNKNGERVTQTEWHNITVWNGLSKVIENYVKKGAKLYIEGKIQTKSYEKDGITRYSTNIVASDIKMLDSKNSEGGSSNQYNHTEPAPTPTPNDDIIPDTGDDLPF